ncbi:hypothetical protein [Nonomuraea sediminis]|uniref:hypothetical protein n=1 Tax=Nonomuraea sediminis TaxID=2835864 RepID=UPI001BDD7685|nr:hypothetical protein [Nonomuraea sediminis]
MATLIDGILDRREMQRYVRGVVDADLDWVLDEVELPEDEWVRTVDNGIAINETHSERCRIKYELWDSSPPPLSLWDSSQTGRVHLTSGKIFAVSIYSGGESHGDVFDLGRRDHAWNVSVHRKALQHEEFTADIVSFTLLKLQFWPTAP